MSKAPSPSQLYTTELYHLRRGCALYVPEPNRALPPEYKEHGVRYGDVGIIQSDGSFDFLFSVLHEADNPINRLGVPAGFELLQYNGFSREVENIFRPEEPILSKGGKKVEVAIGASASLPGLPIGAGAGFSIKFDRNQGAIIIPPNGVNSTDCCSIGLFRRYAEKHAINWYKFVNETHAMEAENGSIYFITGADKTNCWENAIFDSTSKEFTCELMVSPGDALGLNGRFNLSESSHHVSFSSRCSPPNNDKQNQALFVRGFRVSVFEKRSFFKKRIAVQVDDLSRSKPIQDVMGMRNVPFSRQTSSSPSGSSSGQRSPSSAGSSQASDTSLFQDASEAEDSCTSIGDHDSPNEDFAVPLDIEIWHPLKVINNYIGHKDDLDVEVVVTHDDDWISVMSETDFAILDDATLVKRIMAQNHILVSDGIARLQTTATNNEATSCPFEAGRSGGDMDVSGGRTPITPMVALQRPGNNESTDVEMNLEDVKVGSPNAHDSSQDADVVENHDIKVMVHPPEIDHPQANADDPHSTDRGAVTRKMTHKGKARDLAFPNPFLRVVPSQRPALPVAPKRQIPTPPSRSRPVLDYSGPGTSKLKTDYDRWGMPILVSAEPEHKTRMSVPFDLFDNVIESDYSQADGSFANLSADAPLPPSDRSKALFEVDDIGITIENADLALSDSPYQFNPLRIDTRSIKFPEPVVPKDPLDMPDVNGVTNWEKFRLFSENNVISQPAFESDFSDSSRSSDAVSSFYSLRDSTSSDSSYTRDRTPYGVSGRALYLRSARSRSVASIGDDLDLEMLMASNEGDSSSQGIYSPRHPDLSTTADTADHRETVGSKEVVRASTRRLKRADFICEQPGCGASFTTKQNLTNHINSHFGIRPYSCNWCDKSFTTAHTRDRHHRSCKRKHTINQQHSQPGPSLA